MAAAAASAPVQQDLPIFTINYYEEFNDIRVVISFCVDLPLDIKLRNGHAMFSWDIPIINQGNFSIPALKRLIAYLFLRHRNCVVARHCCGHQTCLVNTFDDPRVIIFQPHFSPIADFLAQL